MKKLSLSLVVITMSVNMAFNQSNDQANLSLKDAQKNEVKHRHSLGASLFMLYNLTAESADYYLLTYGYQLSPKDRVLIEYNTWKYAEPMGTYGHSEEFYPGFIRTQGIGIGYQRFHWRGLFTTAQATSFMKQYYDANDKKIQKGFQLYLQLALGYRIEFLKKRLYVEPAFALKYWPIDTNIPEEFAAIAEGTPKTFFEPGLNFGFKF